MVLTRWWCIDKSTKNRWGAGETRCVDSTLRQQNTIEQQRRSLYDIVRNKPAPIITITHWCYIFLLKVRDIFIFCSHLYQNNCISQSKMTLFYCHKSYTIHTNCIDNQSKVTITIWIEHISDKCVKSLQAQLSWSLLSFEQYLFNPLTFE
jgi:hypothetical protein